MHRLRFEIINLIWDIPIDVDISASGPMTHVYASIKFHDILWDTYMPFSIKVNTCSSFLYAYLNQARGSARLVKEPFSRRSLPQTVRSQIDR